MNDGGLRNTKTEAMRNTVVAAITYYTLNKRTDNRTTENVAEKFIGALTELESARDVEQIVSLFADDCEVGNVVISKKFRGIEGARLFWMRYRAVFKDVCSVFQNEICSVNQAKLEWITEGKIKNGRKIKYEGVSILETKGGKITHFYAYFDKKILSRQITGQPDGKGFQVGGRRLPVSARRTDFAGLMKNELNY